MSTKTTMRKEKGPQALVNDVMFGLDNENLLVDAKHKKDSRDKTVFIVISGGISQKVVIRRLRFIIAYLEKEGLPTKPVDELLPLSSFVEGRAR